METLWPRRPVIYEIDTWVWLNELSQQHLYEVTLGNVPVQEWDKIAALGVDAVWLMGVWERSPEGIQSANQNPDLQADFRRALPDYTSADNVGSAYCVRRYIVDKHLGGPEELAVARQMLAQRGLRLILDFIPNHVAPDHPWTREHPEYFVQGTHQDLRLTPEAFFEIGTTVIARGRDPFFPPWPDVAQLNAFSPDLRRAASETVCSIAEQCDGIRCDMVMLLLNNIFERTWGERVGKSPSDEYWQAVISTVRARYPQFLLLAETYWDLEWTMQQLGFDYCYDKRLYDRLLHDPVESIRLHLTAGLDYQDKLVRFIENHDEPRAAEVFPPEQERAAVVVMMTLPGARLLYEGQCEGRKVRPSVFLARRPVERVNTELLAFYRELLAAVRKTEFSTSEWQLCERTGWPDNQSYLNIIAWCWSREKDRYMVVVNFSQDESQARVHLPWNALAGSTWQLTDVLNNARFERAGSELQRDGLYVNLPAWTF
ncbi:MAG TPA: alpha-amylase family glycosyl hydrolase, partial [Ktedonobacteraceae bacterium]|nr:alpha-amylase family glycosyl hydrolase [Ktedonobacteraceae bacterium]